MEWIVEAETLSDFIDHGRYTLSTKPLIMCRDCKHLFEDNKCPLRTWWTHTEDDFCSYAERRADE